MKFLGIIFLSFIISFPLSAQHNKKEIILGNIRRNFKPDGEFTWLYYKYPFTRNILDTGKIKYDTTNQIRYDGCTQIHDADGNMVLYSQGGFIYNKNMELLENGFNLISPQRNPLGIQQVPRSMVLLPFPQNDDIFYLFHTEFTSSPGQFDYFDIDTFFYSIIDISKHDEKGEVTKKNNVLISSESNEENFDLLINAVPHGNGRDYWILVAEENARVFHYFLLDPTGVHHHHSQVMDFELTSSLVDMEFNKAGNLFVTTNRYGEYPDRANVKFYMQAYQFDRCEGELTFQDSISWHTHLDSLLEQGFLFSETDRFFYMNTATEIYQFDTWKKDWLHNYKIIKTIHRSYDPNDPYKPKYFGGMMQTYHGEIWSADMARSTGYFRFLNPESDFIEEPIQVVEESYPQEDFEFIYSRSFPHFPNYTAGPLDGSSCDTLGLNNEVEALFRYYIPNKDSSFVRFWDVSFFEPTRWEWDFGDGNESKEEYPTHTYEYGGTYYVCLTVRNPYSEDTYCNDVTVVGDSMPVSIIENNLLSLKLFPNPVHNNIIYLSNPQHLQGKFMIYNSAGKATRKGIINGVSKQDIDISGMNAGVYFMQVSTELGVRKLKVVVMGK